MTEKGAIITNSNDLNALIEPRYYSSCYIINRYDDQFVGLSTHRNNLVNCLLKFWLLKAQQEAHTGRRIGWPDKRGASMPSNSMANKNHMEEYSRLWEEELFLIRNTPTLARACCTLLWG